MFVLKIVATSLLCALVWIVWSGPEGQAALASYVDAIGSVGIFASASAFLIAIALYCRTLSRCLFLIEPEHRAAEPTSVWLMFLIPYNFIEDFFIVGKVARSLRQESSTNRKLHGLKHFGIWSGTGWCTAQLLSFAPGSIGELAALVGGFLWARHWQFIAKVNRLMARSKSAGIPAQQRCRRAWKAPRRPLSAAGR